MSPLTTDFLPGFPGRLVEAEEGVSAFVPDRLPPTLDYGEFLEPYARASEAVGGLRKAVAIVGVRPILLMLPLLRREAIYSSQIEGTYTSPMQLALFEAGDPTTVETSQDAREVLNYIAAITDCIQQIKIGASVSHSMIRGANDRLLLNVKGHEKRGKYRDVQNYIGKQYAGIKAARFIPPPWLEVRHAMDDLVSYIETSFAHGARIPPLINTALIHYQFETIHPFEEGNGRVGRMLIPLILYQKKIIEEPVLHLSASIEKRKDEYMDSLLRVSQKGAWREWIRFFLEIVEDGATEASGLVQSLALLREDFKKRARGKRISNFIPQLIDALFEMPTITIGMAMRLLGVSRRMAGKHLHFLAERGIVREVTGRSRNLVFSSDEVFRLIIRFETRPKVEQRPLAVPVPAPPGPG